MIAGKRLNIEGKMILCPPPPIYLVKAGGVTVDIGISHYDMSQSFDRCVSNERELWKMDNKGAWHLVRRMWCGKEKTA